MYKRKDKVSLKSLSHYDVAAFLGELKNNHSVASFLQQRRAGEKGVSMLKPMKRGGIFKTKFRGHVGDLQRACRYFTPSDCDIG